MTHGSTRVATGPRSPQDAAKLAHFENVIALPLVLSALLPLILLPGSTHSTLAIAVNVAAWLVFLVDFVVHERLQQHHLSTWVGRFDLSVVILTAPWFLIFGPSNAKFVLVIRLARIARLVMAGKGARRLFAQLGRVFIVAIAVLFVSSGVAYYAEHPTNSGFATFGDALWWGIVTLTTVGYGDIVPETTTGRLAGVFLMVTGVAVLGVLAGSLAGFFRLEPQASKPPESSEPAELAEPAETGEPYSEQLQQLTDQLSRLADEVAALSRKVDAKA
jgi:voltage-gated potassium channel